MKTNVLYYGDNLEILRNREYFEDTSIDLIYLDPPFNSKKDYNILFKENGGVESEAQIRAFTDSWHWTQKAEDTYRDIVINGPTKVGQLIGALHEVLGNNDVMAYLVMMTARLIELHRVLKRTGSLYLHCDPTASHYLKLVLDQIFGPVNFRNEIAWCYRAGGVPRKGYPSKHDTIFFYTKGKNFTFNHEYVPYTAGTLKRGLTQVKGKYFKKGLRAEGTPIQDWWSDLQKILSPTAKEILGYPTQKPLALLERIIKISSNEGDIVLDPFCGCGTAVVAAQKLNRKWIGIDITHLAINLMRNRLKDSFSIKAEVIGEPVDLAGAKELASQPDKYQFQWWALGLIGARPLGEKKKGADKGIDGVISFIDDPTSKPKRAVVQVKSGHVHVKDIRELITVAGKDAMGIFITLEEPTKDMEVEAVAAGYYRSPIWNKDYPKIQILTIEDILHGKTIDMPPLTQANVTFTKAPKIKKKQGEQPPLKM
jgi:site-specific DNA-methyltransferase (adenine-specific)